LPNLTEIVILPKTYGPELNKISAALQLDNKVLKSIYYKLYYQVSPYEFSLLSVEILGSDHGQFLGKQIKLTDKHKAQIEEKPEVRKAGGIYYTLQYIVDYIIQQTVGKLVEGKKCTDVASEDRGPAYGS
jgi:adenine-specific DNA-methyltransferase